MRKSLCLLLVLGFMNLIKSADSENYSLMPEKLSKTAYYFSKSMDDNGLPFWTSNHKKFTLDEVKLYMSGNERNVILRNYHAYLRREEDKIEKQEIEVEKQKYQTFTDSEKVIYLENLLRKFAPEIAKERIS